MDFYTSFHLEKGKLLLRGVLDGKRYRKKLPVQPYLFLPTKNQFSSWRTLQNEPVEKKIFNTPYEASQWVKDHADIGNFPIYGMMNYDYVALNDEYKGKIEYDPNHISVGILDIEVLAEEGFPRSEDALFPINAITLIVGEWSYCFGCHEFQVPHDKVLYFKARDEAHLIQMFLEVWDKLAVDVVTGWNIEGFDIPYIVNRIKRLYDDGRESIMSPWRVVKPKVLRRKYGSQYFDILTYEMYGVNVLDYQEIYKKFSPTKREMYSLDYVAYAELGEKKLDYSEYGDLNGLYRKNFQKFMEYNVRDCLLVQKLEDRLGILMQIYAFAYDAKVSLQDTMTTVRPWDVIIHNELLSKGIVVPQKKEGFKDEQFKAAYVKEPVPGKYKYVQSFDLTSLYPMLAIQYNISPETLVKVHPAITIEGMLDQNYVFNEDEDYAVCANGAMFMRDKQGFLGEIFERMFNDRDMYKQKMKEAAKKYEATKDKKYEIEKIHFNNYQLAKKIQINSAYGALGNLYFRWYDVRLAEAITYSGQLAIKWIGKYINIYMNELCGTEDIDYVIAMDTDSCYLNFETYIKQSGLTDDAAIVDFLDKTSKEKIEPFINKTYEEMAVYTRAYKNMMNMKREAIATSGIWTAKKRYVLDVWDNEGVRYKEPQIKITGLEAIKTTTPEYCRDRIKEAYGIFLRETEEEFWTFIRKVKGEFFALPFEEIAIPKGVNGLAKYHDDQTIYSKRTPIHVRGSLLYNKLVREKQFDNKLETIKEANKIKYCYLKVPNPIMENVISCPRFLPREFGLDSYLDLDMQFEKVFLEPLTVMTDILGWQFKKTKRLVFE